jgi:hypothetical protein
MQTFLRFLGWSIIILTIAGAGHGLWSLGTAAQEQDLAEAASIFDADGKVRGGSLGPLDLASHEETEREAARVELRIKQKVLEMESEEKWDWPSGPILLVLAGGLITGLAFGAALLGMAQGLDLLERLLRLGVLTSTQTEDDDFPGKALLDRELASEEGDAGVT